MNTPTRRILTALVPLALLASACGSSSDDAATDTTDAASTDTTDATTGSDPTDDATSDDTTEVSSATDTSADVDADVASLFVDGALTADAVVVDCTLENGSETTCYQFEVSSLADTVDTDGPYCPDTVDDDEFGIWVWDGDDPGLYALDADFWAMMADQGFDFVDDDGNITIPTRAPAAPTVVAPPTRVLRRPPTARSTSRCSFRPPPNRSTARPTCRPSRRSGSRSTA